MVDIRNHCSFFIIKMARYNNNNGNRDAEDATVTCPAEETKAQEETKETAKGETKTKMIKQDSMNRPKSRNDVLQTQY